VNGLLPDYTMSYPRSMSALPVSYVFFSFGYYCFILDAGDQVDTEFFCHVVCRFTDKLWKDGCIEKSRIQKCIYKQ
jgi:hypothetical protein